MFPITFWLEKNILIYSSILLSGTLINWNRKIIMMRCNECKKSQGISHASIFKLGKWDSNYIASCAYGVTEATKFPYKIQ